MRTGERIWIIGASAGIGAALARAAAARGARLTLSARDGAALEALAAELGPGHRALPLDLAAPETLAAAAERALEPGARFDRLINLAALYDPTSVTGIDPQQAARLLQVNLMGSLHVARLAPRALVPGGQLVLFGSAAAIIGLPQGQLYSASKAAVRNLAESLRAELAPAVDVRLVTPGFIATRLTAKNDFAMPGLMTPEAAAARILAGLDRRGFEIAFPRRLIWPLRLLAALPYAVSLRLTGRMRRGD